MDNTDLVPSPGDQGLDVETNSQHICLQATNQQPIQLSSVLCASPGQIRRGGGGRGLLLSSYEELCRLRVQYLME